MSDKADFTVTRSDNPIAMDYNGRKVVPMYMHIKFPVVPDCGRWATTRGLISGWSQVGQD
jgi:hypothetical protein